MSITIIATTLIQWVRRVTALCRATTIAFVRGDSWVGSSIRMSRYCSRGPRRKPPRRGEDRNSTVVRRQGELNGRRGVAFTSRGIHLWLLLGSAGQSEKRLASDAIEPPRLIISPLVVENAV